ncbi:hypothetical protein L682_10075 [Aquipseudomonas alcaligenes OT 69]|nr:hypothetical protein L682_10075 [Pseudomonas alcaligenes OT 69]
MRRRLLHSDGFSSAGITLALAEAQHPDYIIWGVVDWHFRHQRPQQLAKVLSASGRRVFYISSNLHDAQGGGFSIQPLDSEGRLFDVRLQACDAPSIYAGAPSPALLAQLRASLGELLIWTRSASVISLVQHPFWFDVARTIPDGRLVYDCMDHHQGFSAPAADLLALEQRLVRDADIAVYTSDWLAEHWRSARSRPGVVIRNATDYGFFSAHPEMTYRDPEGRRIIGYYGAIADWFDVPLIAAVAEAFPRQLILLIGADTVDAQRQLRAYRNVKFTGEVPYTALPGYLHGMDVCLLPFRVTPLTLATNPVKVYEYLSAGKPVVCVDLPEIIQFGGLVYRAADQGAFIAGLAQALAEAPGALAAERQAFAAEQTWAQRVDRLIATSEGAATEKMTSVIVVTYNNLHLTRACLASLSDSGQNAELEIIVVDNGSHDGTPEFLAQWAAESGHRVILNADNRGFSAANNQGLAIATGRYLVLLNNDTQVTPGWADALRRHLKHNPGMGLVGPVTNNIGNQAKIDIDYSPAGMTREANLYTRRHLGEWFPLPTLAFFCVMMRRETYLQVGLLDEAFGCGFFEDDDYCRRVEQAGLFNACAQDAFVHHHLSASFNQMDEHKRKALFERNKAIYENKWGPWIPHRHG